MLLELIGAFALAAVGVGIALHYARRSGRVDVPNHRSSHAKPTPSGGGIAIVLSVGAVSGYALRESWRSHPAVFGLLFLALAALTTVGWRDDRKSMSVGPRLAVHLACGVAIALLVNAVSPMSGLVNFAWLGLWFFWTVASINIVNFMDGVDGIVSCQGVVYGLFLFALGPPQSASSHLGLILAGACGAFLLWNWQPAKIFMGDVGSGPLGFLFVICAALAFGAKHTVLVLLPLYPLYLDALITLIGRVRRGERLSLAHRSHLYQRIANGGAGHALVSLLYAGAASVGALVVTASRGASAAATISAVVVYCAAGVWAWKLADARWPL